MRPAERKPGRSATYTRFRTAERQPQEGEAAGWMLSQAPAPSLPHRQEKKVRPGGKLKQLPPRRAETSTPWREAEAASAKTGRNKYALAGR